MTYFEVLVEGASDVPMVREIMTRRFDLVEAQDFRIHPHKGRGRLPSNPLARPGLKQQGLLDQLPAKLQGFSHCGDEICVLVVVDVDDMPCGELLAELNGLLAALPKKPRRVLFRLAIEETESWFIADGEAVKSAYPKAKLRMLRGIEPDAIVGAWEKLAEAIGETLSQVTGRDKYLWAERIAPHVNLATPMSPSLGKFISGVERELKVHKGE
ncbi:MAG: DUF4276 family protein [Methylococcaceae bacterium]|nr:DUF4276 family protein [Methylococcaceae bacterium]